MWKSKDVLKKEAADLLFPLLDRLDIQDVLKQYDIVLTWESEKAEALLGFLEAGAVKALLAGQDSVSREV